MWDANIYKIHAMVLGGVVVLDRRNGGDEMLTW